MVEFGILPIDGMFSACFALQLENNRFHVKDFYEELRIFNKNHVAVRRIANSRISFNRSAFAVRVVTKREAIERIYHALVEEVKLLMQQ